MFVPENILSDDNNMLIGLFGSRLYGTHSDDSDYDYIIIQKKYSPYPDTSIHCFTETMFNNAINNGDIACLEVLFSNSEFWNVLVNHDKYKIYKPDIEQFRRNISMLCNNSWVKGKKRLIVIGDYDMDIALKSIFHSIRIYDFAKQIIENGRIIDFKSTNWLYFELVELGKKHDGLTLWNIINDRYRKLFNTKASEFRSLCPISKTSDKDIELKNILKNHGVLTTELLNDIKAIYN